jgi:hypothetical protein
MLLPLLLVAACSVLEPAETTAILRPETAHGPSEVKNANHVFNAIHSSMRQWGSSYHHNGMSLFPAVVPEGTQLYHGGGEKEPVQGLEWLAFEPEHAINFAIKIEGSERPPKPPPPDAGPSKGQAPLPMEHLSSMDGAADRHAFWESVLGHPLSRPARWSVAGDEPDEPRPGRPRITPGWLQTYRTREATPLLYIDGMAAAKSPKGTLDTQDLLLLNTSGWGDQIGEQQRAKRLCKLAADRWQGKIKGFIRMEAGFEIIMCSFADSLEHIRSSKAGPFLGNGSQFPGAVMPNQPGFALTLWEWVKFVAARYDGIGGGRVKLDYDTFVTAFNYDLELFTEGADLPQLGNVSATALDIIRDDIDTMMTNWNPRDLAKVSINWQRIADMVVERYAGLLNYLVSGSMTTSKGLVDELALDLRVFIDSDARNTTEEVRRCARQFNPPDGDLQDSIAARSIWNVTERICKTLFTILDKPEPLSESLQQLQSLVDYLDWSTWKKCSSCPYSEVCFIPMFPLGAIGDRENPQCRNATGLWRFGYWRGMQPQ